LKNGIRNASNIVPYGYAGKVGAIGKSGSVQSSNAVGYNYVGKAAIHKSISANDDNTVGYGYASKTGAVSKSICPNAGKTGVGR